VNKVPVKITKENDLVYLTPQCALTDYASNEFDQILRETCENEDIHIVLDFKSVDYLFSRTIGSLVHCHQLQKQKKKELVIINASETFCNLWDSINLSQLIPAFPTFKEFLAWTDHIDKQERSPAQTGIVFENREGISIVKIEAVAGTVNDLGIGKAIDHLLREAENPKVVIDLKKTATLDWTSMESLVLASNDIREKHGRIIVAGASHVIKELFHTFSIDGFFEFADGVEDGIRLLSGL
jgi:anti-anti-sigma factor